MTSPLSHAVAERIDTLEVLDPPAQALGKQIRGLIPKGPIKDGLSGTWLGHALHPVLTDIPIGTFTSAALLDLIGGAQSAPAAERLIAIGLAAAPATLATGWNDWADAEPADAGVRRAGIVHASLNGAALALMAASLKARRGGSRGRGKLLGLVGLGAMSAGGWLGGHLSFAQGVGVDTTVFDAGPDDWTATGVRESDLGEGEPRCALVDGVPVLLVRDGGRLHALHNRCTHRGGSLAEGEVADGTVTCPLHGSVFALDDGAVRQGPAAYPQPLFEARPGAGGEIEVRRSAR